MSPFFPSRSRIRALSLAAISVLLVSISLAWASRQQAGGPSAKSRNHSSSALFAPDKRGITPAAATITVNSTSDVANASDGLCTLREAITAANTDTASGATAGECAAGSSSGPDVIQLTGVAGTIDLASGLPAINADMSLNGPGASALTIRRSTAGGTPDFRIFVINSGRNLTIAGVTVSNGSAVGAFPANLGGDFFNSQGTLAINNCVVKNAVAGGGIGNLSGAVVISHSVVSGNVAWGIINGVQSAPSSPATVTIDYSTFSGNLGSAVYNSVSNTDSTSPASIVVSNSTISGNTISSANDGPGIHNRVDGSGIVTVDITNTTISGNINNDGSGPGAVLNAARFGGSPSARAVVRLTNSTVFGNSKPSNTGLAAGIGISDTACGGCDVQLKMRNTVVAGNTSGADASDISGFPQVDSTSSFNLIGTGGSGGLVNGVNGNQVGVANPGLAPLANNGGPTMTHALLATSPALDAGDNCVTQAAHCGDANISQLTNDQRGSSRIVDGPDGDATATVDIGAYEGQLPLANLPDMSINEDSQVTVGFDPGDTSTITSVTATSSNSTLVPNDAGHLSASVAGSNGAVTMNPAADANGTTNITVTVNRSVGGPDTKTFMLTVNPVNDAPSFTKGPDQTVNEDAGAQEASNWATAITTGPPDESASGLPQTWAFQIVGNTNPALFSAAPAISVGGTLSYTPAVNANGTATITVNLKDSGGTTNGGVDTSAPQTFVITVNAVNDPPSFTRGADQIVSEDSGAQTVNWATAISRGPADESGQTLSFTVSNDNNALFSAQPAISPTGTLTYTPAANANGSTTVIVSLKDNGGTANGGVDTSTLQTFSISVLSVNDAPSFTTGINQTVNEDGGAQTVNNWATAISAGPSNESGQTLNFQITGNTNAALFSAGPAVSSSGTLTFTPAANANGSATITINLMDNGGTVNGGVDTSASQTFVITVNAVNDAPSFTKGADQTVNEDVGAQSVVNWATAISRGAADESGQTLTFQVTNNTNASLFSAGPAVSSTGTLTYTPAANANGSATVTINLKDNGGTANGGADTSALQTFTITVNAVNDVPSFTKGANQTAINAAGAQTVNNWATNISAGPSNESSQIVTFQITGNTNSGLFTAGPAVSSSGTLTYTPSPSAGGTATITLVAKDNGGTSSGGVDTSPSQSFTITVTPAAGFVNFAASSSNTTEDSGSTTINVVRTGNTATPITVDYATNADTGVPCSTSNGIASPKCDFTAALGTLSFAVGETSKSITILTSQDSFVEAPETITVTLSNPTANAALGTPSSMSVTIVDDVIEPPTNAIDDPNTFVRMHYHDFLNREADQSGLAFWTGQMTNCGNSDLTVCRINVSGAFFLSIEFQQTGYLVERMYKTGYGDATGISQIGGAHQIFVPIVRANEFLADTQRVSRGVVVGQTGWETVLENNKQAYALEFVQTSRFITALPTTMTPAQFVDKLNTNAGGVLSVNERQNVINLFGNSVNTSNVSARAQAVRQVAEDPDLFNAEANRAFVLTQYIGYLRRNPNDAPDSDYSGYDFWLGKLIQFNGNYINAEMVKAFISSPEYRQRFGP